MPEPKNKIRTEITVREIADGERTSRHRFYFTFNELKSAAIVIAREIVSDDGENAPRDVVRFLDEFGKKAA